jgi:hypothetical protein
MTMLLEIDTSELGIKHTAAATATRLTCKMRATVARA